MEADFSNPVAGSYRRLVVGQFQLLADHKKWPD